MVNTKILEKMLGTLSIVFWQEIVQNICLDFQLTRSFEIVYHHFNFFLFPHQSMLGYLYNVKLQLINQY